jgi:hypothetical protein
VCLYVHISGVAIRVARASQGSILKEHMKNGENSISDIAFERPIDTID